MNKKISIFLFVWVSAMVLVSYSGLAENKSTDSYGASQKPTAQFRTAKEMTVTGDQAEEDDAIGAGFKRPQQKTGMGLGSDFPGSGTAGPGTTGITGASGLGASGTASKTDPSKNKNKDGKEDASSKTEFSVPKSDSGQKPQPAMRFYKSELEN